MLGERYLVKQEKSKELFDMANSAIWYLKEKQTECEQRDREASLPTFVNVQRGWIFDKAIRTLSNGVNKITLNRFFSAKEANDFLYYLEIMDKSSNFFEEIK